MNFFTVQDASFFPHEKIWESMTGAVRHFCPSFQLNPHLLPGYRRESTFWGQSDLGLVCGKVLYEKTASEDLEREFSSIERRFKTRVLFYVFFPESVTMDPEEIRAVRTEGFGVRFFQYYLLTCRENNGFALREFSPCGGIQPEPQPFLKEDASLPEGRPFFMAAALSREELEAFFEIGVELKRKNFRYRPIAPAPSLVPG